MDNLPDEILNFHIFADIDKPIYGILRLVSKRFSILIKPNNTIPSISYLSKYPKLKVYIDDIKQQAKRFYLRKFYRKLQSIESNDINDWHLGVTKYPEILDKLIDMETKSLEGDPCETIDDNYIVLLDYVKSIIRKHLNINLGIITKYIKIRGKHRPIKSHLQGHNKFYINISSISDLTMTLGDIYGTVSFVISHPWFGRKLSTKLPPMHFKIEKGGHHYPFRFGVNLQGIDVVNKFIEGFKDIVSLNSIEYSHNMLRRTITFRWISLPIVGYPRKKDILPLIEKYIREISIETKDKVYTFDISLTHNEIVIFKEDIYLEIGYMSRPKLFFDILPPEINAMVLSKLSVGDEEKVPIKLTTNMCIYLMKKRFPRFVKYISTDFSYNYYTYLKEMKKRKVISGAFKLYKNDIKKLTEFAIAYRKVVPPLISKAIIDTFKNAHEELYTLMEKYPILSLKPLLFIYDYYKFILYSGNGGSAADNDILRLFVHKVFLSIEDVKLFERFNDESTPRIKLLFLLYFSDYLDFRNISQHFDLQRPKILSDNLKQFIAIVKAQDLNVILDMAY